MAKFDWPKIGICKSLQLVDELPIEEHDIKVDFVITEKNLIECPSSKEEKMSTVTIIVGVVALLVGLGVMFVVNKMNHSKKLTEIEFKKKKIIDKAKKDANEIKYKARKDAKKEAQEEREDIDDYIKDKKEEIKKA